MSVVDAPEIALVLALVGAGLGFALLGAFVIGFFLGQAVRNP